MHYCPTCINLCYCRGDEDDELCPVPAEGCVHRCDTIDRDDDEEEIEELWCFECDRSLGRGDCDLCYNERVMNTDDDEEEGEEEEW